MNTPRNFRPELFGILNAPPQQLSKREFIKIMYKFIQKNGWEVVEFTAENPPSEFLKIKYAEYGIVWVENQPVQKRYFKLDNPIMRALTDITGGDGIYIQDEDGDGDGGTVEEFFDTIYKRFRI